MKYTINAKGKKLGRVAAEAVSLLIGKNTVDFARNRLPDVEVVIENASRADITEKKRSEKTYASHSGVMGSLKLKTLEDVISKKGVSEAIRRAVMGMLPKNKLRAIAIKNLKILE